MLTPAGMAALVLAPLAACPVAIIYLVIALPWLFELTNADPDGHSEAWVYPVVVLTATANAVLYLLLAAQYGAGGIARRALLVR